MCVYVLGVCGGVVYVHARVCVFLGGKGPPEAGEGNGTVLSSSHFNAD